MKNYFIIHGTNSNQFENWFPWLFKKLENAGEICIVPQFPTGEEQHYLRWKKILQSYISAGIVNVDTVFICHALGALFVTRFVIETKISVAGIISVSGFNGDGLIPEINELNRSFLMRDKKLPRISRYVKFFHCIYSDNDAYIPIENLMSFAKLTNSKIHEIEGAGHLNAASGYSEFPFLWELLMKINTIV